MTIRQANPADWPQVAEIWNGMIETSLATFTTTLKTPDMIAAYANGVGAIFVAETEGQIAGFSCYSQFRNGPGYGKSMEHSIVIDPRFHGQGLGAKLLDAVEGDARAKGYHVMVAGVSSANPGGRRFHEKMGYSFAGTLSEVGLKEGQWLDLHLLQKLL